MRPSADLVIASSNPGTFSSLRCPHQESSIRSPVRSVLRTYVTVQRCPYLRTCVVLSFVLVQAGPGRSRLVQSGPVWSSLVQAGPVWCRLASYTVRTLHSVSVTVHCADSVCVWAGPGWSRPVQSPVQSGPGWSRLVQAGPVWLTIRRLHRGKIVPSRVRARKGTCEGRAGGAARARPAGP